MTEAVRAFGYPFRPGALRAWLPAMVLVLVLPVGLVPLLGYGARAIRTSATDPDAGPPSFRPDRRLFTDGLLLLLAFALLALPFALAAPGVYGSLRGARLIPSVSDPFADAVYAGVATGCLLLVPWALALLLLAPPNTAAFAASGRLADLLSPLAAGRRVRRAFLEWNVVTAVCVTAWSIGVLGAGLLCVGFLPGAVYAMLVTAHATSILVPTGHEAGRR